MSRNSSRAPVRLPPSASASSSEAVPCPGGPVGAADAARITPLPPHRRGGRSSTLVMPSFLRRDVVIEELWAALMIRCRKPIISRNTLEVAVVGLSPACFAWRFSGWTDAAARACARKITVTVDDGAEADTLRAASRRSQVRTTTVPPVTNTAPQRRRLRPHRRHRSRGAAATTFASAPVSPLFKLGLPGDYASSTSSSVELRCRASRRTATPQYLYRSTMVPVDQ